MKKLAFLSVSAILLSAYAASAWASYPTRPIKIVVGMAPGGAPDIIARTLGETMTRELGQAIVVENRPGAGGTISSRQVARAPADGYTLLMAEIPQLAMAPWLFKTVGYDLEKDFAPIGTVAITPLFIAANAKATAGIDSIQTFIERAKQSPASIHYSSSGIGSLHHVAMEVFIKQSDIALTHVPYKGSGQAVPALVAGEVPVGMTALPAVGPYVASGEIKLLATTSAQRFSSTPEIPALSELFPGYEFPSELGLLAPSGTPQEAIDKISRALKVALESPEIQARLQTLGSIPSWSSPQACGEKLRSSVDRYKDAVKLTGIQAE